MDGFSRQWPVMLYIYFPTISPSSGPGLTSGFPVSPIGCADDQRSGHNCLANNLFLTPFGGGDFPVLAIAWLSGGSTRSLWNSALYSHGTFHDQVAGSTPLVCTEKVWGNRNVVSPLETPRTTPVTICYGPYLPFQPQSLRAKFHLITHMLSCSRVCHLHPRL